MKKKNEWINVIGYVRTAIADLNGEKINKQQSDIYKYCSKHDLNLLRIFGDNGASGNSFERRGWSELKDYIKHNKDAVNALVVSNHDRIGRDVWKTFDELESLKRDFGIAVFSANEPQSLTLLESSLLREKKNAEKVIVGQTVMVHPHLTTDPIQCQGEIGKVSEVSMLNNEVLTVEFPDGKKGAYFSDGLLILYPLPVIRQGLQSNIPQLNAQHRQDLVQVIKLLNSRKYVEALQLAAKNDTLQFLCTTNCENWMQMISNKKKNLSKGYKK